MNINSAFPSKYLKASDLGDASPIVTIDHVTVEQVGKDKEQRPIVYFAGKEKGVCLNKTNANKIIEIAGTSETDEWPGVKVQLFVAMVEFGGETVEAIRVRAPKAAKPAPAKPKPIPAHAPEPDDIDAAMPDSSEVPF